MAKKKGGGAHAAPKKKSYIGAAVGVLVLLAVLALGGAAIWMTLKTDGFTRTKYIVYNGQEIGGEASVELSSGENIFELKALPLIGGQESGYSVKIEADPSVNFYYRTSGGVQAFSRLGDVTEAFEIVLGENSFTLTLAEGYSLRDFLTDYSGEEVSIESEPQGAPFMMTVTFSEKSKSVIRFTLPGGTGEPDMNGVTIDPPHVVF